MPPRNEAGSSLPRSQGSSTSYSVIPSDSVQDVAEALGLPQLHHNVASILAADVEYRIRQLVQDASKFMRHAKRNQLRVSDIDRALRQRNIEPIFGFHPTTLGKASNSGAYPTPVGTIFRRIQTQSGPIHMVADEEIDLEKVLDVGPKVALTPGVGWSAHWLAIEGVQPAVPQNPSFIAASNAAAAAAATTASSGSTSTNMVQPGGASAFLTPTAAGLGSKPGQAVAKPLIKHVLSRELQLYFERLTVSIIDPPSHADTDATANATNLAQSSTIINDTDGDISMAASSPKAMDLTTNTTSDAPTNARKSSGNTVRDAALASLRGDPGLHQLVPYLIQWINEKVQGGLRDEKLLELMLHTIEALISNPYLGIEPYVHQVLPFVLSILLTASLGHSPSSPKAYMLRIQAASVLRRIKDLYSPTYPTLLPRILRTIDGALDAGCAKAVRRAMEQEEEAANEAAADESQSPQTFSKDRGPRDSASTKLGAVVGLRLLGAGSLSTILVLDARTDAEKDCILRRLGFWCAEAEAVASRKAEVQAIVDEVKASFAEVSSSLRGGNVSIVQAEQTIRSETMRERLGTYWTERLADDADAAKGALALLSDLQQREVDQ